LLLSNHGYTEHVLPHNGNGGLAILAKTDIQYKNLPITPPPHFPEVMAIQFKITHLQHIAIVNLYSHPDLPITRQIIEN
jgi:hypothetical protein